MKKNFRHYKREGKKPVAGFWNKEYQYAQNLALSDNPSEDLIKFTRWLIRESGQRVLHKHNSVLDLGAGNGRNLIYLAKEFGMNGVGYDIAREAINQALTNSKGLDLTYQVRSIAEPLPLATASQALVLDMMTSHFLTTPERAKVLNEIVRVLKSGGYLFIKTFLLDEDEHAKRLLREHPADEPGSYIHPKIGVAEHAFNERELIDLLAPHFTIHKIVKSHRHLIRGRPAKRRSICVYGQLH
ncbi:MAG: class I SAM-dependent methyltransferase [Candidatus Vogelbacteria bacterium]|nr:class I SAM-dependent methyltransferase [Candidatus Vogelbacteria bacterium]